MRLTWNRPKARYASINIRNSFLRDVLKSAQNSLYIPPSILRLSTFQLFPIISHKFFKLKLFRITRNRDNPFMKKNNSFWKKLEYLFQQMRGFVVEKTNWSESTKAIRRLEKVGSFKMVLEFSAFNKSHEELSVPKMSKFILSQLRSKNWITKMRGRNNFFIHNWCSVNSHNCYCYCGFFN